MNKDTPAIITPYQMRAARALLDWSRAQCSEVVGISPETIKNIEQGRFTPSPATLEKVRSCFAAYGVEFFTLRGVALRDEFVKAAPETVNA